MTPYIIWLKRFYLTCAIALSTGFIASCSHIFHQVGVPVLGRVENMSYLICGCCGERTPIFGGGGGEQMAQELKTPLRGQVPLDPKICQGDDTGRPLPLADENALISRMFEVIAVGLNQTFAPDLNRAIAPL